MIKWIFIILIVMSLLITFWLSLFAVIITFNKDYLEMFFDYNDNYIATLLTIK